MIPIFDNQSGIGRGPTFIMFHTLQVLSQPDVFCNGGPENRCILVIINFPSSAISWVGWVAFTTTNTTTYYYFYC